MSPSGHPMTYYYDNKFVLTEDSSYFFPYRREFCFPLIVDILREIFDLDDPEVYREVRGRLAVGLIIVGSGIPPLERTRSPYATFISSSLPSSKSAGLL